MRSIDAWIISKLEALCHWTQRNFGLTSVHWYKVSIIGSVVLKIGEMVRLGFGSHFYLDAFIITLWILNYNTRKDRTERTMNSQKIDPILVLLRVISVSIICLFGVVELVLTQPFGAWFYAATFAIYFSACDDLPPAESRFQSWIKSFRMRIVWQ